MKYTQCQVFLHLWLQNNCASWFYVSFLDEETDMQVLY